MLALTAGADATSTSTARPAPAPASSDCDGLLAWLCGGGTLIVIRRAATDTPAGCRGAHRDQTPLRWTPELFHPANLTGEGSVDVPLCQVAPVAVSGTATGPTRPVAGSAGGVSSPVPRAASAR